MLTPLSRMLAGGLIGLIGLIAMVRLVGAGFPGSMAFAQAFVALAMIPWVVYAGWRARHGKLTPRSILPVVLLGLVGIGIVWLSTVGPVLALGCSMAGFVIIWLHDLPPKRQAAERLVRIDELTDNQA